jgi:hypothetical protein
MDYLQYKDNPLGEATRLAVEKGGAAVLASASNDIEMPA